MKKTVLIFGISSFIGSNLAQILKDDFRVVGTYFKTPVNIPGVTCIPCDILKKDYVSSLVSIVRPHFTIYAIGMSSLTECNILNNLADALNTGGAITACKASERVGSKFIYISSSYVLSGEDMVYKEGDTPFPATVYGTTLSSAEFYVQRSCLNYFILRCSNLYGRSYNPKHENWFEILQTALAKNEVINVDDSVHTGFLDIYIVGKILKTAMETNITNRLFHISSKDTMTRYEFAKLYADIFHKDKNLIQKVTQVFPIDQNLKRNTSASGQYYFKLDTTNLEECLNTKMPKIEDSLGLTLKRFQARV